MSPSPLPPGSIWNRLVRAARLAPEPRETFTERIRTTVHSARVAAVNRLGKGDQA